VLGRLVACISDDPVFRQKAMAAAADEKLGGKRSDLLAKLAGHGIALSARMTPRDSEALVRSGSAFEEKFGMTRDDFVTIIRQVLNDELYREHFIRLAKLPEADRRRVLKALRELIPAPAQEDERTAET
jgi:hypothetical protein